MRAQAVFGSSNHGEAFLCEGLVLLKDCWHDHPARGVGRGWPRHGTTSRAANIFIAMRKALLCCARVV